MFDKTVIMKWVTSKKRQDLFIFWVLSQKRNKKLSYTNSTVHLFGLLSQIETFTLAVSHFSLTMVWIREHDTEN